MVLLANNIRDIAYDSRQGIKTIGILLGNRRSLFLYAGLILAVYLDMIGIVVMGILSPWGPCSPLSPKGLLLKGLWKKIPEAADAITAQLNTMFGILLIVGLILNRCSPVIVLTHALAKAWTHPKLNGMKPIFYSFALWIS
jgi:1,4-dihydroxy-2-naphthoate octaprenyltransferase